MSKRENRKAYHKAREKEYLALERKRNEEYKKKLEYEYIELDQPVHIGYVKYYDIAPSLIGTKLEPLIKYVLDYFQYEGFSKNKNFISGKGRNRRVIVPQLKCRGISLDIPNDVRRILNIRFDTKPYWIPGVGYYGDYHMSFVSDSYTVVKVRKEYNYYQKIVDGVAVSNYYACQQKINREFIDKLGSYSNKFERNRTNRKIRQNAKYEIRKAIVNNNFEDMYCSEKVKDYSYWY